ncbi:MAG: amidohydrolase family protein [Acidimicrobiia bacterium]
MTTYDVHAHCIPPDLIDLLGTDGARFGIELVTGERGKMAVLADGTRLGPLRPDLGDMEARVAAMDEAGVDVQFLSGWVDLTAYAMQPEPGAAYSRRFNQILVDEASRRPGRFLTLGTVPLQDPHLAADELVHAVQDLGMVGVQIATTVAGTPLDEAGLEPFWQVAEELRCLILLHPCNPLQGLNLKRHFLDNMIGRPAESTIAIASLIFGGVLEQHPELVVCTVHGGGFTQYQIGRMQQGYNAVPHLSATRISTPPAELAGRLYYDTVLHDPAALAFLVEQVGAERVVMGTDYPFEMGDRHPVGTVGSIPGLTDEGRSLIRGGNVTRILAGMGR